MHKCQNISTLDPLPLFAEPNALLCHEDMLFVVVWITEAETQFSFRVTRHENLGSDCSQEVRCQRTDVTAK